MHGNTYESSAEIEGIKMPVFLRSEGGQHVYEPGPGFFSATGTLGPYLPFARMPSTRRLSACLRRRVA